MLAPARVSAHDPLWSLTELAGDFGRLFVARLDLPVGQPLRVRVRARDVILASARPERISTLNILAGTVEALVPVGDEAVEVQLRLGSEHLLARITRRSSAALGLAPGRAVFAMIKSVAIDRRSLGSGGGTTDIAEEIEVFDG